MSGFNRVLSGQKRPNPKDPVPMEVWLNHLEAERDALIMRLRQVDKALVKYGRLSSETIPRRRR